MSGLVYVHNLDPIIFSLGPLRIGWYGAMYALGFISAYFMMMASARRTPGPIAPAEVSNLLTYIILGVVVGGRLGWVLFYGGWAYLENPLRIFETWKGGMSFHGGLLGVTFAIWLYGRRHKVNWLEVGDFVITWVPLGLFFGRIGNFINGELYGKATDGTWGVVFPGDPQALPRHPSQLYEAALEGLLIFLVLLAIRNRTPRPGFQPAVLMLMYGVARIAVEFVRLPDADIGYYLGIITRGQILSVPLILAGLAWLAYLIFSKPRPRPAL